LVQQVLWALRSHSERQCVVIGGPNTRAVRRSSLCADHAELSFEPEDDNAFVDAVERFAAKMHNPILIPADCKSVRLVNRVRERLPLRIIPVPDTDTLEMFDDKWRFFQFCKQNQLPVPATRYVGDKRSLNYAETAAQLGVPFLIKPINQAGSNGVQVIVNEAHYDDSVRHNPAYQFDSLIAQQYIEGRDVGINLMATGGKLRALAFQQRVGARIHFFADKAMEALARQIAGASGYHGVMNLDARIQDGTGDVFLLESNPRFWASLTAAVDCGLNFVAESIATVPPPDPVRMLKAGTFHMRHPAVRPSTWLSILFDSSGNGRLLRAKMADMQGLRATAKSVAEKPWRAVAHLAGARFRRELGSSHYIQRR
jgi:predicted ATP-grasp superfamily ATP-dependent carboligase